MGDLKTSFKKYRKMSKELNVFKTPPDANKIGVLRRKRKVKVLEEDEYVEKVEKIIERDFFPELDKHKARSDYIDAADRNDTNQMQRLRERFSTGRSRLESPATFDTLDKFLSKHTSEDNESFNDLMEDQQKELERTH